MCGAGGDVQIVEAFCIPPHRTEGNVAASPRKPNFIGVIQKCRKSIYIYIYIYSYAYFGPCKAPVQEFVAAVASSYPITALNCPLGLQKFEASRIYTKSTHEDGKVVSPRHRPPVPSEDTPDIPIC
jgi:hypothetical protein